MHARGAYQTFGSCTIGASRISHRMLVRPSPTKHPQNTKSEAEAIIKKTTGLGGAR